jgi:hypothetical protein
MNHSNTHPGVFVIHLAGAGQKLNADLGDASEKDVVLHELGHVVGAIFNLPGSVQDCRNPNPFHSPFLEERATPGQSIWNSEVEAWDLAETMLLAGFKEARRNALNTYEHYREIQYYKPEAATWLKRP